ncbi:hypothetical protein H0H81_003983, partial [Sphagnurus paluster]
MPWHNIGEDGQNLFCDKQPANTRDAILEIDRKILSLKAVYGKAWEPMPWSLLPCVISQYGKSSSKTNTDQDAFCVSEFMQVAKEYAALRGDDKAREKYVADREAIATALIQ